MSEESTAGRGRNGRFVRTEETAERDAKALRLRAQGLSVKEIAARLEFAEPSSASKAISRALAAVPAEAAAELRAVEAVRLDALLAQLQPGIEEGDAKAITEARKISESRRRLFGLDGPVTVHMVTTGSPEVLREQIEAKKAQILEERARAAGEGDGDA
jgi:hypothetical protein